MRRALVRQSATLMRGRLKLFAWRANSVGVRGHVLRRGGRDGDDARATRTVRSAVNAKNAYWTLAQNRPEMGARVGRDSAEPGREAMPDLKAWSSTFTSKPNCSRRLVLPAPDPCSTTATAPAARGLIISSTRVMISHSIQLSQTRSLSAARTISSDRISPTSARRQPLSRSSVGRSTARTP